MPGPGTKFRKSAFPLKSHDQVQSRHVSRLISPTLYEVAANLRAMDECAEMILL